MLAFCLSRTEYMRICVLFIREMRIRRGKITLYLEHPIPIEPPAEAPPPPPQPLEPISVILALGVILYLGQFLGEFLLASY